MTFGRYKNRAVRIKIVEDDRKTRIVSLVLEDCTIQFNSKIHGINSSRYEVDGKVLMLLLVGT
jgi:hypothetical protein